MLSDLAIALYEVICNYGSNQRINVLEIRYELKNRSSRAYRNLSPERADQLHAILSNRNLTEIHLALEELINNCLIVQYSNLDIATLDPRQIATLANQELES